MPSYQYVNNSGGLSTINASTANEALSSATDRQSSSGVQLLPTPQGTPAPATIKQAPAVITSSTLQPQPTLTVPQANPSPVPTATTIPTPAEALLKNFDLTQNEQAATSAQENIVAKMLENITNQQGESAYKTKLLNESNIGQKRQDLVNLNSQILQKQAEIQQDDITLVSKMRAEENRDTLLPFAQNAQAKLAGDAAIIRALKTSEIGVLNALAIGKQGDLQLAKDTINEAVDAKFAPYKEQNALYEAQLKAIQPFLDKAEKKQALAQQTKVNLAIKEIDKVSDFQKNALANAISNNAPQSVLNAINSATTIDQITKFGSKYIQSAADKLDLQLKKAQLENIYSEIGARNNPQGKPPTDIQITNAGYASRIAQANQVIDTKADTFGKMNYLQFKLIESNNPLASSLLTPDQRQTAQAMRNFITAKLRKESGAAIAQSEFDDARAIYFPQLGDDVVTLANKKQLRDSVLNNLVQGSGSAYISDPTTTYLDFVTSRTGGTQTSSSYANGLLNSNSAK